MCVVIDFGGGGSREVMECVDSVAWAKGRENVVCGGQGREGFAKMGCMG